CAGVATAVIVLLLGVTGGAKGESDASVSLRSAEADASSVHHAESQPSPSRAVSPVLKTAAQLCTDFACMRDVHDLQQLLARASDVMDAAGVVVWLGSVDGAELQPALSHGYSESTRARLPNV